MLQLKAHGFACRNNPDIFIPSGLGRQTLSQVIEKLGLDQDEVLRKLAERGIQAKPDDKMKALAEASGLSPTELYQLLQQ